jgi:hypothetical protein
MGKAGAAIGTSQHAQNLNPAPSSYVVSIKTDVPITLNLQYSNFAKWRELFLVALGRYIALSWIYGLISSDLFDIIMAHGSTTRKIWKAIANLFHDNKKSHSLALDAEFCNTSRGDMRR